MSVFFGWERKRKRERKHDRVETFEGTFEGSKIRDGEDVEDRDDCKIVHIFICKLKMRN